MLLLLAALTLFSGCGGKKNQETENPATDTALPVAETSPSEPAPASLDDIIAALQSSMEANFGENFSLTQDGESLRVNVWRDGLGANANAIVAAGAGVPEQWTTIVNSFQSMSASIQTALDANGYQNISVTFNVLSELDKSTLLLSIVRDTVVYDFLNLDSEKFASRKFEIMRFLRNVARKSLFEGDELNAVFRFGRDLPKGTKCGNAKLS